MGFSDARASNPDLVDVLMFLWRHRRAVSAGGVAGMILAGAMLFLAIPHYRVSMIVGPATDLSSSGLAAFGEGLDVSSPLVSVRGSGSESPDFIRFERTLTGPAVAQTLFQDPKIREGLARGGRFHFLPVASPATPEALSDLLSRTIFIESVGLTPLRRLVYSHPDPAFALYLIGTLHRTADARIRVDAKLRSAKRIAFLESRMEKIRHPDQLRALATLLTDQEQISMIAAMDEPYAAAVIEPASASPRSSWPPRSLVFAVFLALGAASGVLWSWARHVEERCRPQPAALEADRQDCAEHSSSEIA